MQAWADNKSDDSNMERPACSAHAVENRKQRKTKKNKKQRTSFELDPELEDLLLMPHEKQATVSLPSDGVLMFIPKAVFAKGRQVRVVIDYPEHGTPRYWSK